MKLYVDAETRATSLHEGREMIPRRLLQAMAALVIGSVAMVSFAVITERPKVGQPKPAEVALSRDIVVDGSGNAVKVTTLDGRIIVDAENGGFLAAVRSALDYERHRHDIDGNPPVVLRQYENGRLQLADPATGWEVELTMFGRDSADRWIAVLNG
ncbi:MAG: photosynthetic complex assembly protein PuhC [Pseudomonadota bacterium]